MAPKKKEKKATHIYQENETESFKIEVMLHRIPLQKNGRLNFSTNGLHLSHYVSSARFCKHITDHDIMSEEDMGVNIPSLSLKDLVKKESTIPEKHHGVFNNGPMIQKNTVVAFLVGRWMIGYTDAQLKKMYTAFLFCAQESNEQYPESNILFSVSPSLMARYINEGSDAYPYNCVFTPPTWKIIDYTWRSEFIDKNTHETAWKFEQFPLWSEVKTTRDIQTGEELFVSYGPSSPSKPKLIRPTETTNFI